MRGIFSASIGSDFWMSGVTLVDEILCPKHSHSFRAKLRFVSFNDMFSLSNFLRIFFTVDICSISDPLATTNKSSIKACACGYSVRIESINL